MNTQQAKRIPLQEILSRLGHRPAKQARGELWYLSPFRPEAAPSFKINPARNVWYDFGEGVGGNVLDFVMRFHRAGSVAEALAHLAAFDQTRCPPGAPIAPQPAAVVAPKPGQRPGPTTPSEATVEPLRHRALTTYLADRGIPRDLARRYLEEIHYRRDGKAYFALSFRNDSGGYELRNPYFKGTLGPKDITLLRGKATPTSTIAVFEGVIDFLSAQVVGALPHPFPPAIVMNSTALKDKALAAIRESGASRVDLYLDHDRSGRELTASFEQELADLDVVDRSGLYAGHKDVNEYLTTGLPGHP
jgi:hypothetical protein